MSLCPVCGRTVLVWLEGIDVWVCEMCDKAFTVIYHEDSPDKLREVAEE